VDPGASAEESGVLTETSASLQVWLKVCSSHVPIGVRMWTRQDGMQFSAY
jgi:hypothetical protein